MGKCTLVLIFYAGKTKNTIVKTNITHPTSPKNIILHQ